MKDLWTDLVRTGRFKQAAPYQRFAYLCAGLLLLSGLVHIGVYLVDGGPWQGPVSWRKPIVFGLSFAIALATLSWIVGLLRPGKMAGWTVLGVLGNTFGAAGALKVPHALTLHAVQVLSGIALALLVSGAVERHVVRMVTVGTVGYVALVGSSLVQTYGGRAPLDLGLPSTLLAGAGLALLGISIVAAVRGLGARLRAPGVVVP